MKDKEWNEALGHLDTELVEEYYKTKEHIEKKQKTRAAFARFGTLAVCLALACAAVLVLPRFKQAGGADTDTSLETERVLPPIPVYPNALYTAEDVARAFSGRYFASAETQYYETVKVADARYLNVGSIPDSEYLKIYSRNDVTAPIDESEFAGFLDGILANYTKNTGNAALGGEYKFEASSYVDDEVFSLRTRLKLGAASLMAEQSTYGYRVTVYGCAELVNSNNFLSKLKNVREGNEAAEALVPVRDAAAKLFGVSFSEASVNCYYSPAKGDACYSVRYSNEDGRGAALCIVLDTGEPQNTYFLYSAARGKTEDRYKVRGEAKMISLEDAEALLYNGYVFGGHICGYCASKQESVSFYGYEYAGVEYVYTQGSPADEQVGFPFYAFYKSIGKDGVGNEVYAKTYVCAVELGGYEEYFENQKTAHNTADVE